MLRFKLVSLLNNLLNVYTAHLYIKVHLVTFPESITIETNGPRAKITQDKSLDKRKVHIVVVFTLYGRGGHLSLVTWNFHMHTGSTFI